MEEAFHALLAGEMDTHDRIVADGLKTAFSQADVVMLARGLNGPGITAYPLRRYRS